MSLQDQGFKLIRRGELAYYQSSLLVDTGVVDHAFSTRLGGLSRGAVAGLNTAFHAEDDYKVVLENRRRYLAPFGYDYRKLVAAIQVHGTRVIKVNAEDRGRGALPGTLLGEGDALVTDAPGTALTGYAADCQLLFLAAPRIPVAALIHSGWRGTVDNIPAKIISYLREQYGVEPGEVLAAAGPCILKCCYSLIGERAERFRKAGWMKEPYMSRLGGGHYAADISRINAAQLREAGVARRNLAENNLCTSCREDLFYSYRRDKGITGRMMGFIAVRAENKDELS